MSASDTMENGILVLFLQNTAMANVGNAGGLQPSTVAGSLFVALHTADPTDSGSQVSSEATYTGYGRQAVARSSGGWTVSGTSPTQGTNAAAVTFGACTAGSNTITHASLGQNTSGAGTAWLIGALGSSLAVSSGITPSFAIGALVITLD